MIEIAYSILSSNFLELEEDIKRMEQSKVDLLHLDIMDGRFVESITFGAKLVEDIKNITRLPLDCHLMVEEPSCIIEQLLAVGVDMISFHIESKAKIQENIDKIKKQNVKVGLVLNPDTKASSIVEYLPDLDFVLQMSVYPGFGGQSFIASTMENVTWLKKFREENDLNYHIEVDGGVNSQTAKQCIDAGADILVSGSFLQKSIYPSHAVLNLKSST